MTVSLSEMGTAMGRAKILLRPDWHNASRIDVQVACIIMIFDMIHVHRVGDSRYLVKFTHEARERGVIGNTPDVAFEMAKIYGIETNQCCEQTPIRLSQGIAKEIALTSQTQFKAVQ